MLQEKIVVRYFRDAIRATLTFLGYYQHINDTLLSSDKDKDTTKILPLQGDRHFSHNLRVALSCLDHCQHFVVTHKLLPE